MKCQKCRDQIELLVLDGLEETEKDEVKSHLRECDACSRERDACEKAAALFTSAVSNCTDPGLNESIIAAVDAKITSLPSTSNRFMLRVAAVFLVVLFIGFLLLTRFSKDPDRQEKIPPFIQVWKSTGMVASSETDAYSPVHSGDRIFALKSKKGGTRVAALNSTTGKEVWLSDIPVTGNLSANANKVFAVQKSRIGFRKLIAFNATTGKQEWIFREPRLVPAGYHSHASAAQGVVCWNANNIIHVFDETDGTLLWRKDLGSEGSVSDGICTGSALFLCTNRNIYSFNTSDGSVNWKKSYETRFLRPQRPLISVSRDRLLVGYMTSGEDGMLQSMDIATGTKQWRVPTHASFQMTVSDERVFLRSAKISAFDIRSGRLTWEKDANGCGPMTCTNNNLFFVNTGERDFLRCLDQAQGRKLWDMPVERSCSAFIIRNQTCYINSNTGTIQAFRAMGPKSARIRGQILLALR